MKRTLFLKVFAGYLLVIALVVAAALLAGPPLMRKHFIRAQAVHLENLAYLIQDRTIPFLTGKATEGLDEMISAVGARTGRRVTVIDNRGNVLADSEKEARDMENHFFRPEIFAALQGEKQMSIRFSSTLRAEMMYMSVPLEADGAVVGVLRMSLFMRHLQALLGELRRDLLWVVGLSAALALVAAALLTRTVSRPVREFVEAASRVSAGDLGVKVSTRRRGEFRALALGFNDMTAKLKAVFSEIRIQGEELTSILASIREGLCVMDADSRILFCNDSFRRAAQVQAPEGKHFWEVVRSSALVEIIRKVRETKTSGTGEAAVGDRIHFCSASYLTSQGRIVVTLHDMTEFRDLERIKKDFVVNVSHELKTPLTAIKGFVETMEQRAVGESASYLGIIRRNADRLIAIVDDLLALSKIEAQEARLEKEDVDVRALAENILKIFEKPAGEKGLGLVLEAGPDLPPVKADPLQLEGLLLNLVDNAVKYTDKGGVTVRLAIDGGRLRIEVADTGIGIDPAHQAHVFERFYVVDKSRSKKLGGTGLGLSLVKHIVLAHQGTVSVSSRLGEGTTFTVRLPVI
ncbi:MAG: HAMP domain-containing protein [Candidatus Aminicenantes bacterium]|nr:HAMP domain-containing protein [Candidatus Aminicenantes bacterium]